MCWSVLKQSCSFKPDFSNQDSCTCFKQEKCRSPKPWFSNSTMANKLKGRASFLSVDEQKMIMTAYEEFQIIIMAKSNTATTVMARQEAWQHNRQVKCVMLRSHQYSQLAWAYLPDNLWFIRFLHFIGAGEGAWLIVMSLLRENSYHFCHTPWEEITTISAL